MLIPPSFHEAAHHAVLAEERQAWRGVWRGALVLLFVAALCLCMAVLCATSAQAQTPPAASKYRAQLVRAAHTQWGLDAPIAALAAQVHQESAWRPEAVSRVGARGLAQFMPGTATWWCNLNGTPDEQCQPNNPAWALRALVGYDKYLHDRAPARFSAYDRMWVALRAYNGGLGHWQAEAKQATGTSRQAVDQACGRAKRHPSHCPENLGYPARILGMLQPLYASWGPVLEPTRGGA